VADFKKDLINQGLYIFPCAKNKLFHSHGVHTEVYYFWMIANNVCSPKNILHDHVGISIKIDNNIAVSQVFSW
jgi:hypothetical protein